MMTMPKFSQRTLGRTSGICYGLRRSLLAPALAASIPISSGRHVKGKVREELQRESGVPSKVRQGPDSAVADPTGEGSPMKSLFAALALASALASSPAWAQTQSQASSFGGTQPKSPDGNRRRQRQ